MKEKLIEMFILVGFGFGLGIIANSLMDNAILRDVKKERDWMREEIERWRSGWVPRKSSPSTGKAPAEGKEK